MHRATNPSPCMLENNHRLTYESENNTRLLEDANDLANNEFILRSITTRLDYLANILQSHEGTTPIRQPFIAQVSADSIYEQGITCLYATDVTLVYETVNRILEHLS